MGLMAEGIGTALGPHGVQVNALVWGSRGGGGENMGYRHFKGYFLLNSDTYFSQILI